MIDSHCHIHSALYELEAEAVLKAAHEAGVKQLVCVGCDGNDSKQAVAFATKHETVVATIGLHPHEASRLAEDGPMLEKLIVDPNVVAVGECGLDYWYEHSPREAQAKALVFQIELALKHDKALVFHVRGSKHDQSDAFSDFFSIIDKFENIRGVVHSFTAGQQALKGVLSRSLLVGVNGIATFTKDADQLEALKQLPLESMLLETDSPFLTPVPKRGNVNAPEHMGYTAEFLAELRGESVEALKEATTTNSKLLFGI